MSSVTFGRPPEQGTPPGRHVMADHHVTARVWAVAALVSIFLPVDIRLGWWLPLHLVLAGVVSQAIVGGHLMFSTTLGMAPTPDQRIVRVQLALMNAGALAVVFGREIPSSWLLATGATLFLAGIVWAGWMAKNSWKKGLGSRFGVTRTFYILAVWSIVLGASIGAALGAGWINDAFSYLSHRTAHMSFNLLGWVGLTILGTIITFLPMVLHVRAAQTKGITFVPWLYFGGLLVVASGLSVDIDAISGVGALSMLAAMVPMGGMVKEVVARPRRRRIPVSALHLFAALMWFVAALVVQVPLLFLGELGHLRNVYVLFLAVGTAAQAVVGSWAFLIPSTRPPDPEMRRRELVAFELGAKLQVAAYNVGLLMLAGEIFGYLPGQAGAIGLGLLVAGAAWGVLKAIVFPWISQQPWIGPRSEAWWTPLDTPPAG